VHQVGNYSMVNSWCTVRKTSDYITTNISCRTWCHIMQL